MKNEFDVVSNNRIQFELTESSFIDSAHHHYIAMLQEEGHRVFIDDFGVGYSSIRYLVGLGVNGVKLDRFFVDYAELPKYAAFVKKVVEMAKTLNLTVVIEGVEKASQLHFFTQLDCDGIQGYFEARPMKLDLIPQYLSNKRIN